MEVTLSRLLELVLKALCKFNEERAKSISSRFSSLDQFLRIDETEFCLGNKDAKKGKMNFTEKELLSIKKVIRENIIIPTLTPRENLLRILVSQFTNTQVSMIKSLQLDDIIVNPLLVSILKLDSPEELIRFYIYQVITRKIVTSLGFMQQNLLKYSSDDIFEGDYYPPENRGTKWNLRKDHGENRNTYVIIKTGLDKAQVLHFKRAIEDVEAQNQRAIIGEPYGNKSKPGLSHGLYKTYLPEWKAHILTGREFWAFIAGDENYPSKIIGLLNDVSHSVLKECDIVDCIEDKIASLVTIFRQKYGTLDNESIKAFLDEQW